MMTNEHLGGRNPYLRGIALSATGIIIISPDGLLLRLIGQAGVWEIIFWRYLFMGLSLALILLLRYRTRIAESWRGIGGISLLSAALMCGSNLGFVAAITHTTVANTLVILATMPLFSALLGRFLIGEKVRPRTWVAILVATGGIVVIFSGSLGGGLWTGNLLAVLTALFMGLNLVVLRKFDRRDMTPALCLAGFLAAGFAALFAEPATVNAHDMALLALLGFLIIPLALALFLSGTRYVPAAEVALLALIETVLGPIWVWFGIGETPSAPSLIGGLIVVGAIAVNAALALRK